MLALTLPLTQVEEEQERHDVPLPPGARVWQARDGREPRVGRRSTSSLTPTLVASVSMAWSRGAGSLALALTPFRPWPEPAYRWRGGKAQVASRRPRSPRSHPPSLNLDVGPKKCPSCSLQRLRWLAGRSPPRHEGSRCTSTDDFGDLRRAALVLVELRLSSCLYFRDASAEGAFNFL